MGISVTRAAARLKITEAEVSKLGAAVSEDLKLVLANQRAALERKTAEYPIKLRKHLERCRRGGIADSRRAAARAAK